MKTPILMDAEEIKIVVKGGNAMYDKILASDSNIADAIKDKRLDEHDMRFFCSFMYVYGLGELAYARQTRITGTFNTVFCFLTTYYAFFTHLNNKYWVFVYKSCGLER